MEATTEAMEMRLLGETPNGDASQITDYFNRNFELIIMPTENCMFDCVYCYEDFKIGRMKKETVTGVKNLLDRRVPGLGRLNIDWFGGEPLMAYDIVVDIMRHVNALREKTNQGLFVNGAATTNAYVLTAGRLEELSGLGVRRFQVSFDGDKPEHDLLRVKRNGGGTFDMIWKNMLDAHRSDVDFDITLRMHVNADNSQSMRRFLGKVHAELDGDKRFSAFIRPLSKLGGKNDANLHTVSGDTEVDALKDYARDLGISLHSEDNSHICYAAKPNSLVLRADGRIGKCTVALYEDFNTVGRLNTDGTVSIDNDLMAKWTRGLFTGNKEDLECPLKSFPAKKLLSYS